MRTRLTPAHALARFFQPDTSRPPRLFHDATRFEPLEKKFKMLTDPEPLSRLVSTDPRGLLPQGQPPHEDRLRLHRGRPLVQDRRPRRRRRLPSRRARQARPQGHDHRAPLRPVQGRLGYLRPRRRARPQRRLLPRAQEGRRPRLRRPPPLPRQGLGQDWLQALRQDQRRRLRRQPGALRHVLPGCAPGAHGASLRLRRGRVLRRQRLALRPRARHDQEGLPAPG